MTTLHLLLKDRSLSESIADASARIRSAPTDLEARWLLFQLLCLTGEWSRALQQLPLAAQFLAVPKAQQESWALTHRLLIEAESVRAAVFAGERKPESVGDFPVWAEQLVAALNHEAKGNQVAADSCRGAGLAAAPNVAGRHRMAAFSWLADGDSRLGPQLELMHEGRYRWLSLAMVRSFHVSPPQQAVDLIWAPATIVLRDGDTLTGHMPARYPGSEAASDALRLGQETIWHERGETGTFGLGRKTWMADVGEWGLFDIGECHLDGADDVHP